MQCAEDRQGWKQQSFQKYFTERKKVCQRNSLFLSFDMLFLDPLQIHYTAPRNLVCLLFPLLAQEKNLRQIHIAFPCLSWKHWLQPAQQACSLLWHEESNQHGALHSEVLIGDIPWKWVWLIWDCLFFIFLLPSLSLPKEQFTYKLHKGDKLPFWGIFTTGEAKVQRAQLTGKNIFWDRWLLFFNSLPAQTNIKASDTRSFLKRL